MFVKERIEGFVSVTNDIKEEKWSSQGIPSVEHCNANLEVPDSNLWPWH